LDNIKNISCPNCGSNDIKIGNKGIIECLSCNGKFLVNVDDNLINAINRIERLKNDSEKTIKSGYKYNPSITKDEFKDQVLLFLNIIDEAPSYIYDELELSPVNEIDVPILEATGHSEINYSRMIGNDKIETWTEVKITKYPDGSEHKENINHSKTVIDWDPDSGMLVGDATVSRYSTKFDDYDDAISLKRNNKDISNLDDDILDEIKIDDNLIKELKNEILNTVFRENISYPGDHVKNETYSGNTKINELNVVVLPLYELELTLRDKTITFYSSANSPVEIKRKGEFPPEDDEEENRKHIEELLNEKKNNLKKPKLIKYLSIISGIFFFILFLILGIEFSNTFLNVSSFVLLFIGIIISAIFNSKIKKIDLEYNTKIDDYNNDRKNRLRKLKTDNYKRYINQK